MFQFNYIISSYIFVYLSDLYNYALQPWKTQKRVRLLLKQWFRNDWMGVPGDEVIIIIIRLFINFVLFMCFELNRMVGLEFINFLLSIILLYY
jgi:uncharacterized membrane protein YcjF (UPF0283 family)